MEWNADAEAAVRKAPFFVRKRIRSRVEQYAADKGRKNVTLEDVHAVKKGYLENMEKEVQGYRIEECFGPGGCPNRAAPADDLSSRLETLMGQKRLLAFLKETVDGPLKFHHEFRITVAECPNACSRPQIKDIGIIGAAVPEISEEMCTLCGACAEACRENAIELDTEKELPKIDFSKCLMCGECEKACPTGTIQTAQRGYRILLGGKLGRHPRLARPLHGFYGTAEVLAIVDRCVDFYKANSRGGKRFAQLVEESESGLMAALADLTADQNKGD